MRLNLLSIDLDWFNTDSLYGLKDTVRHFFHTLSETCKLTTDIVTVLTDHHYMYPWAWELMRLHGASSVNVVNVDTHHDFYFLDNVYFDDPKMKQISCGNFFAFMAHEGILGSYDWVTSSSSSGALNTDVSDFMHSIDVAKSRKVKNVPNRTRVWNKDDVWYPIQKRTFDGLAVIKSPNFTFRYKTVLSAATESLNKYFPTHKVRSHTCTRDYPFTRRKIRMRQLIA